MIPLLYIGNNCITFNVFYTIFKLKSLYEDASTEQIKMLF